MLDQMLEIFSITLFVDLNVIKVRQTLTQFTICILEELDDVMKTEKPDMVLVHGDNIRCESGYTQACLFFDRCASIKTREKSVFSSFPSLLKNSQQAGLLKKKRLKARLIPQQKKAYFSCFLMDSFLSFFPQQKPAYLSDQIL